MSHTCSQLLSTLLVKEFCLVPTMPGKRKSTGGEKPGTGKNTKTHDGAAVREKHPWIASLVSWFLG